MRLGRKRERAPRGEAVYPVIQIGQLLLPTLGVAAAAGVITAVILAITRARAFGAGRVSVFVAASAALMAGVFGNTTANHLLVMRFGQCFPSVAFAAGVATAALAVKVWSLMTGDRFYVLADCFAQPIALALAVERFGCFMAGCSYGQPTDQPWGIVFNNALALAWYRTPIGVRLQPAQLYECLLAVLLLVLLKLIARHKLRNGSQFLVLAAAYAFGRYFIEFLRGDAERGFLGPLSIPQWLCALTLIASVILLTRNSRRNGAAYR